MEYKYGWFGFLVILGLFLVVEYALCDEYNGAQEVTVGNPVVQQSTQSYMHETFYQMMLQDIPKILNTFREKTNDNISIPALQTTVTPAVYTVDNPAQNNNQIMTDFERIIDKKLNGILSNVFKRQDVLEKRIGLVLNRPDNQMHRQAIMQMTNRLKNLEAQNKILQAKQTQASAATVKPPNNNPILNKDQIVAEFQTILDQKLNTLISNIVKRQNDLEEKISILSKRPETQIDKQAMTEMTNRLNNSDAQNNILQTKLNEFRTSPPLSKENSQMSKKDMKKVPVNSLPKQSIPNEVVEELLVHGDLIEILEMKLRIMNRTQRDISQRVDSGFYRNQIQDKVVENLQNQVINCEHKIDVFDKTIGVLSNQQGMINTKLTEISGMLGKTPLSIHDGLSNNKMFEPLKSNTKILDQTQINTYMKFKELVDQNKNQELTMKTMQSTMKKIDEIFKKHDIAVKSLQNDIKMLHGKNNEQDFVMKVMKGDIQILDGNNKNQDIDMKDVRNNIQILDENIKNKHLDLKVINSNIDILTAKQALFDQLITDFSKQHEQLNAMLTSVQANIQLITKKQLAYENVLSNYGSRFDKQGLLIATLQGNFRDINGKQQELFKVFGDIKTTNKQLNSAMTTVKEDVYLLEKKQKDNEKIVADSSMSFKDQGNLLADIQKNLIIMQNNFSVLINSQKTIEKNTDIKLESNIVNIKILNDTQKKFDAAMKKDISEIESLKSRFKSLSDDMQGSGDVQIFVDNATQAIQSHGRVLNTLLQYSRTQGAVYVRWGRRVCGERVPAFQNTNKNVNNINRDDDDDDDGNNNNNDKRKKYRRQSNTNAADVELTETIYEGQVVGSNYQSMGAAVNYLCLPPDPIFGDYDLRGNMNAYLAGASIENWNIDIPGTPWERERYDKQGTYCAVCRTRSRMSVVMIPGRNRCYPGWTKEYDGYLTAGNPSHAASSEYQCLDKQPDRYPMARHAFHKMFYAVEAVCDGTIACPPYQSGKEITCVVCSK